MVPGPLTILAMEPKMIDLNVIYLFLWFVQYGAPGMDCLFSFPCFLRGDGWLMVQFETLTKMEHFKKQLHIK